jgi:hypothetical protein
LVRRFLAFATASLLASGAVVGVGAAPVSAASLVAAGAPSIISTDYPSDGAGHGGIGGTGTFTLTYPAAEVADYMYRFTGEGPGADVPWQRWPLTSGTGPTQLNWFPFHSGPHELSVYAVDRNGNESETAVYPFQVRDSRPYVTSDDYDGVFFPNLKFNVGIPGEFRINGPAGVARLEWRLDEGGPDGVVNADAQGDAVVTIAPHRAGNNTLWVRAVEADGRKYAEHPFMFLVDNGPLVTRGDDYVPPIGSEVSFHVEPRSTNVAGYEYWFLFGPRGISEPVPVEARPDGTADFTITAADLDLSGVYVQTIDGDGNRSVSRWISLDVDPVEPEITRSGGAEVGAKATFTARTRMSKPVSYTVRIDGAERVVKAAADGTAKFDFTPATTGEHRLEITAVNAAGIRTGVGTYSWKVADASPRITSVSPSSVTLGGVRTITVKGANLRRTDVLQVTLPGGKVIGTTIRSVTADGATVTADVNLAGAPTGVAGVTLRRSSATSTVARAFTITLQAKPVATKKPAISGTVAVGNVVKVTPGIWSPAAGSYAYQWAANGVAIKGATRSSYTIPASLLGKRLTVTVTAKRAGHHNGTSVSAATAAVAKGKAPKATKKPKISGTAKAGKKLTAGTGSWSLPVNSYKYQWRVNGKVIKGATARTLKLKSAWKGKKITVTVTARTTGHADGKATSASVKVR